jgi:hypothetical protein
MVKEGLGSKHFRKPAKLAASGAAGLAGPAENRYIAINLWFSYDRVLRVGPSPDPLFFIT